MTRRCVLGVLALVAIPLACDESESPTAPPIDQPSIETAFTLTQSGVGAPIAVPDAFITTVGVPLVVAAPGTLHNDLDLEGDGFIMSNVTFPTNGQLTSAVTNGAFTYAPEPGFIGTDAFTYVLRDDDGNFSAPGTVTIQVLPDPNRAPLALPDYYATLQGQSLVVTAPGTLRNDLDPDGDGFIMSNITFPTNGQITSAVTNGAFTYVPDPGFNGADAFTYVDRDDNGAFSASGMVNIAVLPPGGVIPIAVQDHFATTVGEALMVAAPGTLANDVDPDGSGFIMSNVTFPTNGQLTSAVTNGAFTYVPNPGFTGTDSFTYILRDDDGNFSAAGTVTIDVLPDPNRPPVGADDEYATVRDMTLVIAAPGTIGNDFDPDGDGFIMSNITFPANGQITSAVTNGAFTYVPNPGFIGTDGFTYVMRDDNGAFSTPVTVTIHVLAPFDATPPVITPVSGPIVLTPPSHDYRTISVTDLVTAVTDPTDPQLSVADVVITRVTSDEPDNGDDDGNTVNDIVIGPQCGSVDLRAERMGTGNGRVYIVELAVSDAYGNVATASVEVWVPVAPRATAVLDGVAQAVSGTCGT